VRDGNLITGQNPASSALVAEHVLAALSTETVAA
jgi:putative intracellular protease/amidase